MEITDVTPTKISSESWGEFVEFPTLSYMSKYEEFRNVNGENPQFRRDFQGPVGDVVVEVETDAGITGIGHANWGTGSIATIIDETLSKLLIGRDPRRRERLWDLMYRATLPFGRRGAAIEAISGIDIALWDIAGKELDKPAHELLGGATVETIPCYASNCHPLDWDQLEAEALEYAERGFDAIKIRMLHGPESGRSGMQENEKIFRTVREAVGDELRVAADAYMGWNVRYAKKMVDRLERYDPMWVEEPVIADNIDGYAEINAYAPFPISGGEHEFLRWGHKQLLEKNAVDILQPDVHRAGGLTETKKIADLAATYDVPVIPHAGTNPTLHFIAAHDNAPMAEYFPIPDWYLRRRDDDRESTYADAIYANPPHPEDGMLDVPPGPGVNATLNREAIAEFTVG